MAFIYERMIIDHGSSFANILRTIMQHDFSTGAILWHCSEGKDRCGMTTALILEILGATRETILEDYLKTNLVNIPKAVKARDELMVSHGLEFADSVYKAYIADERYLRAAWDEMGPGYLQDRIQITPEMRESAGGNGSKLSTGGMTTKLEAADLCMAAGIDVMIVNGARPDILYDVLEGSAVGTRFIGRKQA